MDLFLWLLVTACVGSVGGNRFVYDHLYNTINSVSFANTVPQPSKQTPLTVKVTLALNRLIRLDADNQELVADAVLQMYWSDHRFGWYPSNMNNVESIVWPHPDKIWTPDLVINGMGNVVDTSPEASAMRLDYEVTSFGADVYAYAFHVTSLPTPLPVKLPVRCRLSPGATT